MARADEPPQFLVRYAGDELTVHATNVPVSDVLDEFARQSGAEIRGVPSAPRDVTAHFDDVPLGEAFYRLLGDQNYALVYGNGGKLRAVKLLGAGQRGPATADVGPSTPTAKARPTAAGTQAPALGEQRSTGAGLPADALAPAVAGFQRVGELWLRGDDVAARDAASSELMAIEAEPESRNEAVNLANAYSDADFAELLRQIAGSRAQELAGFIASQTRVTELRMKALAVQHVLSGG